MLKFFVAGLLLCKASSYVLRGDMTASPQFSDDFTTTEDYYTVWSPNTPFRKKLGVDDGYREIKGLGAYKVYNSEKTWHEAYNICKSERGNLIVIRTTFEAVKVAEVLEIERPMHKNRQFWLGLRQDMDHEHHLRWKTSMDEDLPYDFALPNVNGNALFSRLVFGPPNISNDQCGLLLPNWLGKISAPCKYPASFICKREPIN